MITVGKIGTMNVAKLTEAELTMAMALAENDSEHLTHVGSINGHTVVKISDVLVELLTAASAAPALERPIVPDKKRVRVDQVGRVKMPDDVHEILGPPIGKENTKALHTSITETITMEDMTAAKRKGSRYVGFLDAANATGLPEWHFRRAAVNRKLDCWNSPIGYVIRLADANLLVAELVKKGWAPRPEWDPKVRGSYHPTGAR